MAGKLEMISEKMEINKFALVSRGVVATLSNNIDAIFNGF